MNYKVLVVGGGGREHAIIKKISTSPLVKKIYCAPSNAGINMVAEGVNIKQNDIAKLVKFAKEKRIDFAIIGPEEPLSLGITDKLEKIGVKVFGPNKSCSRLESSKLFTKKFLTKYKIPTARYKVFKKREDLEKNLGIFGYPMVLKADGLAAGKGVIIAKNKAEAKKALVDFYEKKIVGDAAKTIIVEEALFGIEASILCFVDESGIVPMESARDYKRIYDNDKGPNTGGMGTYSPNNFITKKINNEITKKILEPTFKGFKKEGLKFKGVLFIGLMLTKNGPEVIEFNNRFGDPETQSILVRLKNDLLKVMLSVSKNKLSKLKLRWDKRCSETVVLASSGYPKKTRTGDKISGLENFSKPPFNNDYFVFHAGTKKDDKGNIITSGGRVLGITALGKTKDEARKNAYKAVKKIYFKGMQFRKDIGK